MCPERNRRLRRAYVDKLLKIEEVAVDVSAPILADVLGWLCRVLLMERVTFDVQASSFGDVSQLLVQGEAYYRSDPDDKCENNSLIQRRTEDRPYEVIRDKKL